MVKVIVLFFFAFVFFASSINLLVQNNIGAFIVGLILTILLVFITFNNFRKTSFYKKFINKQNYKGPIVSESNNIIKCDNNIKKEEPSKIINKPKYDDLRQFIDVVGINDDFDYVAYDLETTGLSPDNATIIEIGALKIKGGEIVGEFSELIKPKTKISSRITEINGITNEMVSDCRSLNEVLPEFIKFTEKLPLIAHNADFDYSFLKSEYEKLNDKQFARRHICTMKKYKSWHMKENKSDDKEYYGHYQRPSAKLINVAIDLLGDDYGELYKSKAHRAFDDALTVHFVFQELRNKIE